MKNRLKLKQTATALKSRDDAEAVLNDICLATINRNKAQLAMDEQITAIREQHEAAINECNKFLEEKTELIRAWAEANPSEFKGKSVEFVHATIGWRTGLPTLKTLAGWTWDRVLEKIKQLNWKTYIRSKEEVNRQQIIAERDTIQPEDMRAMGLKVTQEETFFIEPKLTELETKQSVEASQ